MTRPVQEFDIAIIGGGLVGTSLASLLAASQPDLRIALIDKHSIKNESERGYAPSFDARSTALAYGSMEIFHELGVWEQLRQHATPIRQVHVSDRGHLAGSIIDAAEQNIEAVGYVIENAWLGKVLSAHIQQQNNVICISPARVESILPRQQGALVHVVAAEQTFDLHCKLAVVADGGDSPLRRALGIETEITNYHQSAIIANVAFSQPHELTAYERFTAQGPLALLPLGESGTSRQAALVWTLPEAEAERHLRMDDKQFLSALQQCFGYRLGRFERVSQRYAYPLQLVTAREQIRSHTVLMGNAAHFLHPVAGQGFNLALRDCVCLTGVLLHGRQQGALPGALEQLQEYLKRQQNDQFMTIYFSDRLVRLFSSASLPLVALRHLGFVSLAALPVAKDLFAAQTMGTAGASLRWLNL